MQAIDVRRQADEVTVSDVIVVGSGIAGLTAALGLEMRKVTVLTKTELGAGSSSRWAQGGVAAAMAAGDSPRLHAADTVSAAAGLGDPAVIEALTTEGPERIRRLIELGARFDRRPDGELCLGREGAHGRRRILHAGGDATGAEIVRALVAEIRRRETIELYERCEVHDLVTSGDRVVGVLADHRGGGSAGRTVFHRAAAVVLATGGLGQLYARTTNPVEATGDGLAMAARAGVRLADLELIQFHPTALDVGRDDARMRRRGDARVARQPSPLVTEALRGEGAILIDDDGTRFMTGVHPLAELAPRDVVARAIRRRQEAGHRVFLDATGAVGVAFPRRFPTVWDHCRRHDVDPRHQPIPVTPAAHYAMAGIAVDANGRGSLPGLWACGEVASTGVHGANRLASNSLLEALVFGARVADDVGGSDLGGRRGIRACVGLRAASEVVWREPGPVGDPSPGHLRGEMFEASAGEQIRHLMWRHVGLERHRAGLEEVLDATSRIGSCLAARPSETRNLLTSSRLVAAAALAREESRGCHYRSDFPEPREGLRHRLFWTYKPEGGLPLTAATAAADTREIA